MHQGRRVGYICVVCRTFGVELRACLPLTHLVMMRLGRCLMLRGCRPVLRGSGLVLRRARRALGFPTRLRSSRFPRFDDTFPVINDLGV